MLSWNHGQFDLDSDVFVSERSSDTLIISPPKSKRERTGGEYSVEKLILGTHTSDGEQNHLMIAEARIPNDNAEVDTTKYNEGGTFYFASMISPPELVTILCILFS